MANPNPNPPLTFGQTVNIWGQAQWHLSQ